MPELHLHETAALDSVLEAEGRHLLDVTLIRAGNSKNGNVYSPDVLREAVPLFEGARAFVDHPRPNDSPERSVRDLAGYYTGVHLDEAGRLKGQLHLIPGHDWLFNLLKEAQGNPDLCGLSIDAFGQGTRSAGLNHISRIDRVQSCDIVTRPSAGGAVERILHSDREVPPMTPTEHQNPAQEPQQQSSPTASIKEGSSGGTTNTATGSPASTSAAPSSTTTSSPTPTSLATLVEAQNEELRRAREELARVQQILNPQATPSQDPNRSIMELVESIKRERDLANASALLSSKLAEARLPEPITRKLEKRFAGRVVEASEIELAIADEKESLAALAAAGQITGMGMPDKGHVALGMSEIDSLQAAFDSLFDIYESDAARSLPRLSGIREAFHIATGVDISHIGGVDRPLLESYRQGLTNKVRSGRLTEAEIILREADVTNATFSYLLGTSMNKRLLADYQAWPSEWQKFTNIVGIKDFKQQSRIRLGAFGSLSTVAEDAAYTTLTLADTQATYSATKRGNLVQITRETIINDDLYAIKQIPQKLAVAAAFTLAEFVYNLLAPNYGNIYDAHPLFDSVNHANTGVLAANLNVANSGSALSSAALQTAVVNMRKQKNAASKPIGLKPRFLLVPPDLEFTAMTILKSAGLPGGNNNDINPMMGYCEPIVSPQLNSLTAGPASTTVWIAVADPRVIDTVEVGFVGGQSNPVLLIQDLPLYGLNFTQDVISYKVRHEYGGAVTDYRGFYLGNN